MEKKIFNTKAFTSFSIAFAFLMSSISGIVLYLTPKGRVANWNTWTLLGLEKGQWEAVHTLFVLMLLVVATFHLFVFNWKVFLAYLLERNKKSLRLKRELFTSLTITLVVLVGTLANVPPFGSVMVLGENIKDYWERTGDEPPVPHVEDLTLDEYTQQGFQVEVARMVAILEEQGITAAPEDRLGDIAGRSARSPSEIHNLLAAALQPHARLTPVVVDKVGYGRMTFVQLCNTLQVDVARATLRLQDQGVTVENPGESLKALASRHNIKPIDIVRRLPRGKQ